MPGGCGASSSTTSRACSPSCAPDAVLVAARGPVVRVLIGVVAALVPRPVIVSGLPGISIPATTAAHRPPHPERPVRAALTARGARRSRLSRIGAVWRSVSRSPACRSPRRASAATRARRAEPISSSPRRRSSRASAPTGCGWRALLVEAAARRPRKTRRREGARRRGRAPDPRAASRLSRSAPPSWRPLPSNLVVSTEAMAHALDTAEGLVTVSSTAAIEAVARGIPVIALDSFGVDDKLINPVFVGSGLLRVGGGRSSRGEFRHPAARVAGATTTSTTPLRRLGRTHRRAGRAASRRRAAAEARPRPPRWSGPGRVGAQARPRRKDRSFAGMTAYVIGVPLRLLLRPYFRRRLKAA